MGNYIHIQDKITTSLEVAKQNSFFLKWLAIISTITFVVSLLVIPWLISNLPSDFFAKIRAGHKTHDNNSLFYNLILVLLRNIFGVAFLIGGILMLFMPGQGILTIVLGISIMVFPGKRRLVNILIEQKSIQHGLNWIRRKTGKAEFDGFD